ncbi:MAG: glycosyltransferase [Puniceicoccales bacterium]|jgi:glycosyltransferase involved in cell wall biosynthesis|nr:glycosyltransferase [Puniceicoccales bacterium]
MKNTLVTVPCYNEAQRLKLPLFAEFAAANDVAFLFVNDGSTDETGSLLDAAVAAAPTGDLHVLHLAQNAGKAEAVRRGMLWTLENTDAAFLGFWDADLATPLGDINNFVEKLRGEDGEAGERGEGGERGGSYEIVTGLRLARLGCKVERRRLRHYLGRFFATCVSEMLRVPVYDSQCGAKLFKRALIGALFGEPFATRWFFDVEVLARYIDLVGVSQTKACVCEYPLHEWTDVGGSRLKLTDFFKAPWELLKIARRRRHRK